ncbi:MAG: hypothetical protein K0R73_497 [Candidatus Midichloriaceae bacterium]|jgi:hypothetical protein|nr:hypothetical protein [Candidatus Midichloriaceae bacterium]
MGKENFRALLEDSCGWNKKLWADALEYGLSFCPKGNKKALEIGAAFHSSLSPALKFMGYDVTCSYYEEFDQAIILSGNLSATSNKYNLPLPYLQELNAWKLKPECYDVIVMKSVLGGICRDNNYELASDLTKVLYAALKPGGVLITLDNQANSFSKLMRRFFGAGANKWTYIDKKKFLQILQPYKFFQKGFGLLNFAKFGTIGGKEVFNNTAYLVDKLLLKTHSFKNNSVLSTIILKP